MPELFLEIGSEEIPSGYVQPALEYMRGELASFFSRNRIKAGVPEILGTPRRLVVSVKGVDALQEDIVELFHGPSVSVAYDDQGKPTKAAIGFARGKGLDVSELAREKTPKGEVVCARVEKKGRPTPDHLNEFLPQFIGNIPFSKNCDGQIKHALLHGLYIGSQHYLMASLWNSVLMVFRAEAFRRAIGF